MKQHFETVIVGGAQAGLAVGYNLARAGRTFVILEANERVGDSWRGRWDSLRVFTPAKYNGMPGMRFPAPPLSFPTKDEVADYQAAYAARFKLPVRTSVHVDGVDHDGHRFVVTAGRDTYEADNVVAATGACRVPKVPAFAPELKASVTQLHSSRYRSQSQLRDGDVLVVGAGNSGAEISLELARTRRVWLAGTPSGEIPFPHGAGAAAFALPLVRFLALHVLNVDTPVGRKAQPKFLHRGAPLVRTKINDLVGAGVERVPRVVGVGDGLPRLADERVLDVANVIWCTGFKTDFTWIHLPVFGEDGRPAQYRGAVTSQPGLYFVGLEFQYAALSGVLPGISRDASYVAKHIAAHSRRSASSQDAAGEYAAVSMPK